MMINIGSRDMYVAQGLVAVHIDDVILAMVLYEGLHPPGDFSVETELERGVKSW